MSVLMGESDTVTSILTGPSVGWEVRRVGSSEHFVQNIQGLMTGRLPDLTPDSAA